jgi:plasmid replication initiation protein
MEQNDWNRKSLIKTTENKQETKDKQLTIDFVSDTVKKLPSNKTDTLSSENLLSSTDETRQIIIRQIIREPMRILSALTHLTLLERRLYWLVLSQIKGIQYRDLQDAKRYSTLTFSFHFSEVINKDVKWSVSYVKDVIKNLGKRTISWETEDEVYTQLTVFPTAQYINNRGVITLQLHPLLIPGFLELGNNFAQYELNAAMKLTSEYAQILYSWLSRHAWRGNWLINLNKFKELVGASTKAYMEFSNLRIRILKPALEQINEHTDLKVSYNTLGQGKKVTSLEFSIEFKKSTPEIEQTGKSRLKEYLETVNSYSWEEKQDFAHKTLRDFYHFFTVEQKDIILNNKEYLHRFCVADCYISAGQVKNDKHNAYIAKSVFNPVNGVLSKEIKEKRNK